MCRLTSSVFFQHFRYVYMRKFVYSIKLLLLPKLNFVTSKLQTGFEIVSFCDNCLYHRTDTTRLLICCISVVFTVGTFASFLFTLHSSFTEAIFINALEIMADY